MPPKVRVTGNALSVKIRARLENLGVSLEAKLGQERRPLEFISDLISGRTFVKRRARFLHPTLMVRGIASFPWRQPRPLVEHMNGHLLAECIRDEWSGLGRVRETLMKDEGSGLSPRDTWRPIFFKRGEVWNEAAAAAMPETADIIRAMPRLGELAFISPLPPFTSVAPHCGPWNLRTNLHLGIAIPEACGVKVGSVTKRWGEGEWLAFDDGYLHTVWNHSPVERLVLVTTLWNSTLSLAEIAAFSKISEVLMDVDFSKFHCANRSASVPKL